jgi:DNA-directed RNA polymerase subunit L|tara:strand:+ start:62 stop:334 length:273 start_codon:yes stop_codon:yes gene_type:complete
MIKILEETKHKIVLNIKGKTHSFCNILRKELLNDKHVKVAAYRVDHPLMDVSELVVETDSQKEPKTALIDAAKRLKKVADDLEKEFAKAV